MSIEEMALRHQVTCEYITSESHDTQRSYRTQSKPVTFYPLKCRLVESNKQSTVEDLLELAAEKLMPESQLR